MPKYLICPGTVWSNDGDIHFVNARQLINLYRVDPKDCVIKPSDNKSLGWRKTNGLIELRPNELGDYSIPKTVQEVSDESKQ